MRAFFRGFINGLQPSTLRWQIAIIVVSIIAALLIVLL